MSLLKDLGSLQLKILEFLAENPYNHRQAIQQKIGYPAEQYASIHHAVTALEKLGYIESKEGTSEKKVKIKLYSCTEIGVFYVLSRYKNLNPTVLRIFNAYHDKYPQIDFLLRKYQTTDVKFFTTFYSLVVSSLPFFQKGRDEGVNQLILLISAAGDYYEWEKFLKDYLEYFPESRESFNKLRNLLNELL